MKPRLPRAVPARMLRGTAFAFALAAACLPAAAHEYYTAHFQIIHPWTDPAPAGTAQTNLYMRFVEVAAADRLIGASSPVAERIELHGPAGSGPDTLRTAGVHMPAGQVLALEPDKVHFVMYGIRTELNQGNQYPLVLVFEKAGRVEVEFVVGSD